MEQQGAMRRLEVHPQNPQRRFLQQAADRMRAGAVVALPTDASYVLACHLGDKAAGDRLRALREIDDKHLLTLLCRDLSELAQYAQVSNRQYRFLKDWTPGAYTFILPATKEVPRRLLHPSRKTVGLRVPAAPIALELLDVLGQPLLCTTLIMPGETDPLTDPDDIAERIGNQIDLLIDGGAGKLLPTTVIDVTDDSPQIIRIGLGPVDAMLERAR